MADAVELATAYLSLVPSMEGAQGLITKQLVPGAEAAGDDAGKKAGGRFSGSMGKAMATAGIFTGVVAGAKGLYEVGNIFDGVADTIRTGTGATGDALDGLVTSAENVGKKVPASFEQAGTVVADVNTRMGLTGGTLETVASQYLEAGRILGSDVDISKTSAAFSAFGIEGEAVVGGMDTLFQVSQATGVGMNELADAVSKNAPALQNLGFSFEETAALAGSLDKAGLNSSAMMSSMSKGLVTLAKDGEEPEAAFKRVTGEIQGFVDEGNTAAALDLASQVFGTKGASQFVGALESGSIALDDLVAGAGLTSDTILGVGDETQDFAEKWQLVQNNAMAALEPLGSAVFTALGDTLMDMMPTLESLGVWLGENTWVFGVLAAAIGGALVVAFALWTASIWASTTALLANPVTWIVIGIVALIAALIMLIANWDAVAAWIASTWAAAVDWAVQAWAGMISGISDLWNGFSAWVMGVLAGFVGWLAGIWTAVSTTAVALWSGMWSGLSGLWSGFTGWFMGVVSGFVGWLAGIWSAIVSTATGFWNGLVGFVTGIPGRILAGLAFLSSLAGKAAEWFGGMKDAAVQKAQDLIAWVGGMPGRILGVLGDVGSLLVNAGSQILQGFLDGLTAGFENVKNFVGGIGSWIADNKGPKAYDLALLVPAGGWIMDGLRAGIEDEIPALGDTLGDVSRAIEVGAASSAGFDVGSPAVEGITEVGPGGADSSSGPAGDIERIVLDVGGEKVLARIVRKGERKLVRA